ncbi:uncharacterized protein LOC129911716 [Episyrphus balteatus]|uniref:uncharacterized protein LOC129911716 n=1 Tax=Episyrphus balteatus TaxID=286459 RepID=UPI0024864679|nr:uncharacterized protein LOC129911716 [Episyrphus balteatus]
MAQRHFGGRRRPPPRNSRPARNPNDANELLYTGHCRGSHQTKRYSHNFDFAGFTPLIRNVYFKLTHENYKLERQLPYCIYQHVMTELLNAYLLYLGRLYSKRIRSNPLDSIGANLCNIPEPIYDYICGIGTNIAKSGTEVDWNLPDIAIPQPSFKGDDDDSSRLPCRSGTFGPVNATSHNVYECYFSPYITSEYVIRSGSLGDESTEYEWSPFPSGWTPENCIPTENLLGYKPIRPMHFDSIQKCKNCDFDDSDTIRGLLCHSDYAMMLCSGVLGRMTSIKIVKAQFKHRPNSAAFIFKETCENEGTELVLWNQPARLCSPFAFDKFASNQAIYYAFKRKRTEDAPGTCFVCQEDGSAPIGWLETRNDNFLCTGEFGIQNSMGTTNKESLQECDHDDWGTCGSQIIFWLDKLYGIYRMPPHLIDLIDSD